MTATPVNGPVMIGLDGASYVVVVASVRLTVEVPNHFDERIVVEVTVVATYCSRGWSYHQDKYRSDSTGLLVGY